jgi:hypothetical protein
VCPHEEHDGRDTSCHNEGEHPAGRSMGKHSGPYNMAFKVGLLLQTVLYWMADTAGITCDCCS